MAHKSSTRKNDIKSGNGGTVGKVERPDKIKFYYLKGPDFRTIHIDGAIGGITPSGFLHIAFYCERAAIPQTVTVGVNKDGTLGDEIERTGKDGIARQMEIDIFVNEGTARNLKVWLDVKLAEFETRREITPLSKDERAKDKPS